LAKLTFFWAKLTFQQINKYFWLNHFLFGIGLRQENPKGTMEGEDYCQ
jgi:uncharacterized protein YgfB (UPF0149 family)